MHLINNVINIEMALSVKITTKYIQLGSIYKLKSELER